MPANLSVDGLIWASCVYCHKAVYRYPKGKLWRNAQHDSACADSPLNCHMGEY